MDPNFPSLLDIYKNVSVALVNTDEMFDISRPISTKIVYVGMLGGGIHEKSVLPEVPVD